MRIRWQFKLLVAGVLIFLLFAYSGFDLMGLFTRLSFQKPDWTEHGLDASAPGFTPEVLYIAGELKATQTQYRPYEGNRYFEITMRGRNQYFRREWVGESGKRGSWWHVELIDSGFRGTMGRRFGRFGTKGGGGMNEWDGVSTNEIPLCVAQNLWEESGFTGATEENLTRQDRWRQTETFQNLEVRGRYRIPRKILFTKDHGTYYGGVQTTTYFVKRIEFRNEPTVDWFSELKRKHFPSAERSKMDARPSASTNVPPEN